METATFSYILSNCSFEKVRTVLIRFKVRHTNKSGFINHILDPTGNWVLWISFKVGDQHSKALKRNSFFQHSNVSTEVCSHPHSPRVELNQL